MAANARLVVQMTPKEKRALEARARRAGLYLESVERAPATASKLSAKLDTVQP